MFGITRKDKEEEEIPESVEVPTSTDFQVDDLSFREAELARAYIDGLRAGQNSLDVARYADEQEE